MKKLNVLLLFLFLSLGMKAQDKLSVFIGNANRYASIELADYKQRLCREYRVSSRSLDNYYRRCGNDWGNVGLALEIARTSGRSMRDVCDCYNRYKRHGWNRVLVEIGIRPGMMCYNPFYDRIHHHGECWHKYYNDCCGSHPHHKPHYKPHKPHKKHHHHHRHHDDDDWDDDDD